MRSGPPAGGPPSPLAPTSYELPANAARLHPLSILVRVVRAGAALLWIVVVATAQRNTGGHNYDLDYALTGFVILSGVISWAVTTWSVDAGVLDVTSGLIRRQTVRLPISRVQAVDLVEPWVGRLFGMAEVRVRSGGGGSGDARLQYLPVAEAEAVRTALIALAHGLSGATPAAPEWPLVRQDNALLLKGLFLTRTALVPLCSLLVTVVLAFVGSTAGASAVGVYAVLFSITFGRRVANLWNFSVSLAADGLRLRAGLGSRVHETVPVRRVQALVRAQPLFWRAGDWWTLTMRLAGGVARRRNQPRGPVRRALLPVARRPEADSLVAQVLGRCEVPMDRPPRRARLRAPLSYHFLAAGHDGIIASASSGRLRRRIVLMPLAKVQSVRFVQGPVSRRLGLASVRIDAAGRGTVAEWRFFDAQLMERLAYKLVTACADARALEAVSFSGRAGGVPSEPGGPPSPSPPAVPGPEEDSGAGGGQLVPN
jgi:putative membrane protein